MENPQEKTGSFFRFEDLRVYDKAIDYSLWLMTNLGNPQTEIQKTLVNSFARSANDIALNIAEGSSHPKSEFDQFLKISKTALRECVIYTELAMGSHLFTQEQGEASRELLMELTRMIGALILSVTRGHRRDTFETDRSGESFEDANDLKY